MANWGTERLNKAQQTKAGTPFRPISQGHTILFYVTLEHLKTSSDTRGGHFHLPFQKQYSTLNFLLVELAQNFAKYLIKAVGISEVELSSFLFNRLHLVACLVFCVLTMTLNCACFLCFFAWFSMCSINM